MRARWTSSLLLLLLGCDQGPVLYLGSPRASDAGAADGALDAGTQDAERDEDDDVPCVQQADCQALAREPYCHTGLLLCVECLEDKHCDQDEHCDGDEGDCEDGR